MHFSYRYGCPFPSRYKKPSYTVLYQRYSTCTRPCTCRESMSNGTRVQSFTNPQCCNVSTLHTVQDSETRERHQIFLGLDRASGRADFPAPAIFTICFFSAMIRISAIPIQMQSFLLCFQPSKLSCCVHKKE